MAKTPKIDSDDEILWHDRKRILGMPISFTRYEVDHDRFTHRKGLFTTVTDELLLYRILDIKMTRTFGQKLFGVGTITLFTADQSNRTLEIKNIKKPESVRKFLSKISESERAAKGVTGKEIYGAAGYMNPDAGEEPDFTDVDGDGIPG